jgi:hypothetical protein
MLLSSETGRLGSIQSKLLLLDGMSSWDGVYQELLCCLTSTVDCSTDFINSS